MPARRPSATAESSRAPGVRSGVQGGDQGPEVGGEPAVAAKPGTWHERAGCRPKTSSRRRPTSPQPPSGATYQQPPRANQDPSGTDRAQRHLRRLPELPCL